LGLIIILTFVESLLSQLKGRDHTYYTPIVGAVGFALIRGLFWHLAWHIMRWNEASVIRDIIFGTIMWVFQSACLGFFATLIFTAILGKPFDRIAEIIKSK
jgi:hypothetical protein